VRLADELESQKILLEQYKQDIMDMRKAGTLPESQRTGTPEPPVRPDDRFVLNDPKVLIEVDDNASTRHPINTERLSLGSSADNDIQINSDFTSPHHACIVSNSTTCVLEDLNSTNGTYVNSKRIRKHALRSGDWLMIGKHRFQYVKLNEKPTGHQGQRIRPPADHGEREMRASYQAASTERVENFEVISDGSEHRIVDN
jgi:pSer/pThr/pTyr-binding forkhead associated (FHA) protein